MRVAGLVVLLLASVGCSDAEPAPACAGVTLERPVLVLEQDAARLASGLGRIDEGSCLTEVADIALGEDPVLSDAHGRPFVSVRDQGVLHEIDRAELRVRRTVSVIAEGEPQPNPWDVDVDSGGRLWVARYARPSLAVVAPDGTMLTTIDLSAWAGPDGIPDMSAVRVVGDRVFVALEHLRNYDDYLYAQDGPGTMVPIDVDPPNAIGAAFDLPGRNPFSRLVPVSGDPDAVLVTLPGDLDHEDVTDGIGLVDLVAGEGHLVITEKALGGSASEVVSAGPTEAYAIVLGAVAGLNPTRVVAFDPTTGQVTRELARADSAVHSGLAVDGPHLLVGDRTPGAARIRVFDRATGAEVGAIGPQLLPPIALLPL